MSVAEEVDLSDFEDPTLPSVDLAMDSEEFVIVGIGENIHGPAANKPVPRPGALGRGSDLGMARRNKRESHGVNPFSEIEIRPGPTLTPKSKPLATFEDAVETQELRSFEDAVETQELRSFDEAVVPTQRTARALQPATPLVDEESDDGNYIRVNKRKSGASGTKTVRAATPLPPRVVPEPLTKPLPVPKPTAATEIKERAERFAVNLSVRYAVAGEFVREYAENLSKSGLFVGGAHHLRDGETVDIEIDLPGYQSFVVQAVVVHVRDAVKARESGLRAGAGLQIVGQPEGFGEALITYLARLGARREHLVFVTDPVCRTGLEHAGFQVTDVPPVAYLGRAIAEAGRPVVGVVVYDDERTDYVEAAKKAGHLGLVFCVGSVDELLSEMDEAVAFYKQSP